MHSKKPLLKHLQNLVTLYYATSWKEIGLQLGIAQGILQTIETNFRTDVETCCDEMFTEWLDTDVTASWGKLIQAVNSPAVTEIINTFYKSLLCNRTELTESAAVEELENKLKDRHIVTRYKSSQDDWFSVPEHFTSVALIHQKKHKTKREIIAFANMHLKGDFTESGKITTDIAEIFKSVECNDNPYTLLIEGAPGIGKTILSKEIVFQWAKGSMLKNEKLVCLIYLRDPKVRMLNSFESFINYISYSQVSKVIAQYICKKSGKDICLVFDGYDEYPEELRKSSFLSNLINHEVLELQLCNIVITSRPSASACLHNNIDLRVEILGFTKEHRKSYIMHALKDNPDAIQDLLEYLESSYSVDAYCHIPLSMAILVFLFKESDYDKNQLPTTQTEINYKFICITICRFMKKSQQKLQSIATFSEVPATHRNILLEISKLAFIALKDDKIVFSASEIMDICPSLLEDPKDWNGLDLLKAVQYFSLEERKDELSFNFLHFSVQELLAAYHISLMSKTQQIKLLKETFWNTRYFNTWIMYVALTKDRPFAFKHFLTGNRWRISTKLSIWWSGNANISIAKKMKEDKIKCLHLFQCFTEAGNDDMCHYVGSLLQDGTIDLSGQALSAIEMYTLSSFLARCVQRHWSLLDLSNCYLDDENFERFYKSYASLTKSTVYINTVNLSSNGFTQTSASQIVNLVLNFNIKNLVFAANEIDDIGIDHVTFSALLEHPDSIKSRFIIIKDGNQAILVRLNTSVASKFFIMFYCAIDTYKDVCLYIESNNSFFDTLLNTNNVSYKSMLHKLISKMNFFSINFKFHVETINSTSEEVSSIINSLASSVPLAVCMGDNCLPLHLYNEIDDENKTVDNLGTTLFCGNFPVVAMNSIFYLALAKSNLKQIYLNGIVLYDYFFYVSPKCTSLSSLQLFNCCTHDIVRSDTAVVNVLSHTLTKTASLKHLNLSACRFKTKHIKVILEAVKQVGIKTIAISDNNLSKEICDIFASLIACNGELQCVEVSNCNLQKLEIVNITKALEKCKELRSLDFSNNVITDDVVTNIAVLIEKCHLIKDLRLQNCQLQYAGIKQIAEAMVNKPCLSCIDLSDNPISNQKVAVLIATIIEHNKNLQKLKFSNCKLQSIGCQQLLQTMAKITSLIHLDLSNNLFTDVTVDSFALMIHQNSNLEYLNISGCCDKATDFKRITHSLVILKSLTHLDLSCNVINLTSAENIAMVVTNNAFLEYLNLSKCEFQKDAFLKIIISLENDHQLECLCLSANSVGTKEAMGIAAVVSKNPFLEKVDFSNCNLTEQQVKIILPSLRNHTSLKHFDISSSTITNHVVNDIVDVIDSNTKLTHLNISDTDIQEYGILKIFKAVQRINTLKCIKICNCTISNRAAKAIADAISVNYMMEGVVFSNNDFHKTGIALIFGVLEEAPTLKSLNMASNFAISNVTTKVTRVVSNNRIMYFNLSNCDLQKRSCLSILDSLILQAPNLQHIDLSGNNLSGTAETMAQLISVSYYLQHVNLANTLMQDEEVMMIIKAMQNINSLHYVNLTSYSINDELGLELQTTIHKNPSIISFELSKLCYKNLEVAVTTLAKTFTIIHNLQQISICFTDCEVDAVATLINNSPCLQHLHLENCSMFEITINNFILTLLTITTLEYLCLVNIVITDQVDDEIAAVMENNTQLKYFKLIACEVTQKALTKYIQLLNVTQLSHLVLSKMDNVISHDTRRLICDSLTHLNLSNVHLDVTKLSLLSLTSLTKLQHLDLSHNPLTNKSADILSSIFNSNNLEHLNLCDCKLQSEGIRVIANSLQAMNIVYLDMSLNTIDIDTFHGVMPALFSSLFYIEHLYFPYCKLKRNINEIDGILHFISDALYLNFIDFGPNSIPKNMINDFKNIIFVGKGNKQICFSTEGIEKANLNICKTENLYHSLHYLNVNNVIVDDEVGNTVAALIDNSPELVHLEMSVLNVNCTVDIIPIIQAAKMLTTLEYLDLNCNLVTSHLAHDTITLIDNNKNIKVLSFPHCTFVINNNSLKIILNTVTDLLLNDIATIIMTTNTIVTEISLLNCSLNNDQLKVVLNAVKCSSSLPYVGFIINEINNKSITNAKDVIENNSRIKEFTKVFKLLVIKSVIIHQNYYFDPVKFTEIHHVGIDSCAVDFKSCNILKQLVFYKATLNTLILSDCQLPSEISEIVEICTHLNILDLTNVTIVRSDNLKYSSIRHSVSKNNLKTICVSCMNFTSQMTLDILNIVCNSKSLINLLMVKCNIDGCEDSSLSKVFLECKTLECLDLSYSKMSGKIPAFIIANSNNLSDIKMVSCDYDTLSICNALQHHLHIVQLNLNSNEFVCNYAVEIAGIIRNNKYFIQIEMAACNFDEIGIIEIFHSIGACSKFQHINFSHNKIISNSVDAVVSVLSVCKKVKYINLQNCGLTCAGSRDVMMALAKLTSLKFVDLSLNEMAENLAVDIAEMIAKNKDMEVLCLPDCKFISIIGSIKSPNYSLINYMVIQFLSAIRDSRSFKRVEFGCIQINDDLASEVAALTARNIGLVQLKFSELILTNSGFKQLTNSLLIIEGLNSISITGVHFTYSQSCHLATLINNNKSVKSFGISNCVISEKGKRIIFDAMINLTSLTSLNLKNIVILDTLEDKVLVVITNNTSLEYLEVTGCEINTAKLREVTSRLNYLKVVSE